MQNVTPLVKSSELNRRCGSEYCIRLWLDIEFFCVILSCSIGGGIFGEEGGREGGVRMNCGGPRRGREGT